MKNNLPVPALANPSKRAGASLALRLGSQTNGEARESTKPTHRLLTQVEGSKVRDSRGGQFNLIGGVESRHASSAITTSNGVGRNPDHQCVFAAKGKAGLATGPIKTNLSTPQCSSGGRSQSRPFPARAVKIMESAGQIMRTQANGFPVIQIRRCSKSEQKPDLFRRVN